MSATVTQDFLVLFLNLGVGIGIGFLFDCYRVLRRILRPGWFLTQAADFVFWILCAALVFGILFFATGGEVRFYTLLIILIGTGIYLNFASSRVQELLFHFFIRLGRFFRFCFRALCFGLRLIFLPIRFVLDFLRISLQVMLGFLRLLWLPERFLLRWSNRKIKGALRAFRARRPPPPPPDFPSL